MIQYGSCNYMLRKSLARAIRARFGAPAAAKWQGAPRRPALLRQGQGDGCARFLHGETFRSLLGMKIRPSLAGRHWIPIRGLIDNTAQREKSRAVKDSSESWAYMAEVLGNSGMAGRNYRLQAGEMLKVIDLCAASSAMRHAGHPTCPTLAFDRVELLVPICHGDLVHMDSRVVSVGRSTMVIQVVGRKLDVLTRYGAGFCCEHAPAR
jgi:hypothetical protein